MDNLEYKLAFLQKVNVRAPIQSDFCYISSTATLPLGISYTVVVTNGTSCLQTVRVSFLTHILQRQVGADLFLQATVWNWMSTNAGKEPRNEEAFYPLSVAYGKMFVNMGLASWNKGGKFKILTDFELFKWTKWILNKSKMTELGTFLILKNKKSVPYFFLLLKSSSSLLLIDWKLFYYHRFVVYLCLIDLLVQIPYFSFSINIWIKLQVENHCKCKGGGSFEGSHG